MRRNPILLGIGIVVLLFLCIQLAPVWLLQTDPPVVQEPQWPSPQVRALAVRACYDCHSNQTQWPLYSRIAPISWYVTFDVVRGRNALNFSEWGVPRASREGREGGEGSGERGGREAARQVERGEMPPAQYLLIHPDAALSAAEKQQLIQGLQALP